MSNVTAVATLYSKEELHDGQERLQFTANYNDPANLAWSKYTPGLHLSMIVTDEVGKNFEQGATYLLTLEKREIN